MHMYTERSWFITLDMTSGAEQIGFALWTNLSVYEWNTVYMIQIYNLFNAGFHLQRNIPSLFLSRFLKVGICDLHPVFVSVYPPYQLWMPEPIFMKLGMYIMAPGPISTATFINSSHQPVSACASLLPLQGNGSVTCISPFGTRQRFDKHVPRQGIHATTTEEL
jgi:hypothetical protein